MPICKLQRKWSVVNTVSVFFISSSCQVKKTFESQVIINPMVQCLSTKSHLTDRHLVEVAMRHLTYTTVSWLTRVFVSYKENEVLWIQLLESYSQHFIFLITCELPNKLECLYLYAFTAWCNVTLQLIGPIHKLQRKWSVVNTASGVVIITTIRYVCNLQIGPIS